MFRPIVVTISTDDTTADVQIPLAGNGDDKASLAALTTLREVVLPRTLGKVAGVDYAVAGETAGTHDFNEQMKARMPWVIAFVLALAFVLLLMTFRSVVIPLTAIVLNLLSVGAAYGLLVLIFQHTWAEGMLRFPSNVAITSWLPMFLFVVLFGLSMDYHVFIISRIRELRDGGIATEEAVSRGIRRTAGTVTSAAMIMVAVFAIFGTMDLIMMKQLGVGLAIAVLIDATIIRGVLLPATMKLLGEWNWYLPRWLEWVPSLTPEQRLGTRQSSRIVLPASSWKHGALSKAASPAGVVRRSARARVRSPRRRAVAIAAEAPTRPPITKERARARRSSSSMGRLYEVLITTIGDLMLDVIVRLERAARCRGRRAGAHAHGRGRPGGERRGVGGVARRGRALHREARRRRGGPARRGRACGARRRARRAGRRGRDRCRRLDRRRGRRPLDGVGSRRRADVSRRTSSTPHGSPATCSTSPATRCCASRSARRRSSRPRLARERGARVSVDVAAWTEIRTYGPVQFRELLDALAPDVLFATEAEWEMLGRRAAPPGAYPTARSA